MWYSIIFSFESNAKHKACGSIAICLKIAFVIVSFMIVCQTYYLYIIVAVVVKKEKRSLAKVAVNDGPYKI